MITLSIAYSYIVRMLDQPLQVQVSGHVLVSTSAALVTVVPPIACRETVAERKKANKRIISMPDSRNVRSHVHSDSFL